MAYFNSFMPMNLTEDEQIVTKSMTYLQDMAKLVHRQNKRSVWLA